MWSLLTFVDMWAKKMNNYINYMTAGQKKVKNANIYIKYTMQSP